MVTVNPRAGGGQKLIIERVVDEQVRGVVIYMPTAIAHAVGNALGDISSPMSQTIYKGMAGGVFPRSQMLAANQEIARRAQRAIVAGWRARLPLKSAPYRAGSNPNKDRLSGFLGDALASPEMTSFTTDRGISFLNTGLLRTEARHWYRVNYGAYGYNVGAIREPKAYPVTVDGHTLFSLHDESKPAPNSWLPRRFKYNDDNEFIPLRGPANIEGGGHRAALFTDLGFKSVADNVGPVYRKMFMDYFREGGMQQRYDARGVTMGVTSQGHIEKI